MKLPRRLETQLTGADAWNTRDALLRVVLQLALLVLVGVMLVYLRPILVPLVLAVLLSALLTPIVTRLTGWHVPDPIAILLALTAATLPAIALVFMFSANVGAFARELPKYQARLTEQAKGAIDWGLDRVGRSDDRAQVQKELQEQLLPSVIEEGARVIQGSFRAVSEAIGYFLLTLLLSGFILSERARFRVKFRDALGRGHPVVGALEGIGRDVRAYMVAKTLISGFTGICVYVLLEICQVDFALLWGLLAFPLNFIPSVGAAVASLPPVLIAFIDPEMSTWAAGGVTIGLVAINGVIGAVIDPRFVGQAVKLSPLVVFLSMMVWGFLWGPVGMILGVPLMVSLKVIFDRVPSLAPIATLMRG